MGTTPDRASRVPHSSFTDTLAAQEAQLAENPLLLRFRESRRALAKAPCRPVYHFVSPESSLNDPNGLCFWRGKWHLFYQAQPAGNDRQHWGHAVSDDLIHWRDLPYAIKPGPEKRCYSGSIWVDPDRAIAIYHGVGAGTMAATASDPLLLNWAVAVGHGYRSQLFPSNIAVPAMDAGLGLGLLADLYDITGNAEWLAGAQALAERLLSVCGDNAPLPRGAAGIDWYESQMGFGFLLHGLARTALLAQDRTGCPLAADYTAR